MKGTLNVHHSPKNLSLEYERIYESNQIERYRIGGANRSIVLQTNRPFLKITNSRKKQNWKLIEGTLTDGRLFAFIVLAIEQELEALDKL
jgi:hypothetical protein